MQTATLCNKKFGTESSFSQLIDTISLDYQYTISADNVEHCMLASKIRNQHQTQRQPTVSWKVWAVKFMWQKVPIVLVILDQFKVKQDSTRLLQHNTFLLFI